MRGAFANGGEDAFELDGVRGVCCACEQLARVNERGDRRERVVELVRYDPDHFLPDDHFLCGELAGELFQQHESVRLRVQMKITLRQVVDLRLGGDVQVPHSYLVECAVAERCNVGPFAYLRPKAELAEGAKAGTFVEIKNSRIGAGSKVPHLSYVGDAEVGDQHSEGS